MGNFDGKKKFESNPECKITLTYGKKGKVIANPNGDVTGTLADGTKFSIKENCTISVDLPKPAPDGTTITLKPDGSQDTRTGQNTMTTSNGTTTTNPNGSTTTTYPDGTTVTKGKPPSTEKKIEFPDDYGIKEVMKNNGKLFWVRLEDNTWVMYFSDGSKTVLLGKLHIVKKPDGGVVITDFTQQLTGE